MMHLLVYVSLFSYSFFFHQYRPTEMCNIVRTLVVKIKDQFMSIIVIIIFSKFITKLE